MTAGVPKCWRRGRAAPLSKKAMLSFTLQNSHGVANVAGEVVAKVVRSQLVGPLAAEARARQHGGVSWGTEFPSNACRLHLKEVARTGRPAAVLFTDLASAFFSALPGLALGAVLSSRKRDQVFDALGIAGEQRVRLEELIRIDNTTVKRQDVAACWRRMDSAGRSLGGDGVRTDFSGVANEPGALPHAGRGKYASPSTCGGIFGTWQSV